MSTSGELVRVTKLFTFEMAHALHNYNGQCRNIHGHSYTLSVTVIGTIFKSDHHPSDGLVMDFGVIKNIVNEKVVRRFDHVLVLNDLTPAKSTEELKTQFFKIIELPFQPTCENLLIEIKNDLQGSFADCKLFSLKLEETKTSFCEWFSTDNE